MLSQIPSRKEDAAEEDVRCAPWTEMLIAEHVESTIRSGVMVKTHKETNVLISPMKGKHHEAPKRDSLDT